MPLTAKGREILSAMKKQYGAEKGEQVFYASKNAGKITGVDSTADEVAPGPRPQPDLLGDLPGQGPSQTPAPVERRGSAPSYATGDAASKLRAWNEANRAFYGGRR